MNKLRTNVPKVGINIGIPTRLPSWWNTEYWQNSSERMHVTVERSLQTTYEETSELINRAHSMNSMRRLSSCWEKYPKTLFIWSMVCCGETHEMHGGNVRRCVTDNDIQGIKPPTPPWRTLGCNGYTKVVAAHESDEYVKVICINFTAPKRIVIHRITVMRLGGYVDWSYVEFNKWKF